MGPFQWRKSHISAYSLILYEVLMIFTLVKCEGGETVEEERSGECGVGFLG